MLCDTETTVARVLSYGCCEGPTAIQFLVESHAAEETSHQGIVLSWERVQEMHESSLTGHKECFVRKLIAVSGTERDWVS